MLINCFSLVNLFVRVPPENLRCLEVKFGLPYENLSSKEERWKPGGRIIGHLMKEVELG